MKQLLIPHAGDREQMLQRTEYIDNIITSTFYDVREQMFSDIFQITPLFDLLNSRGNIKAKMPNGRYFELNITYGKADQNEKWFGRGDTFSEGEKEIWTRLQYQRKNFGDSIVRFWDDEVKNRGKAAIFSYAKELIQNHKSTCMESIGRAVWIDGGAKAINTLPDLITTTPTTGTVGGLDRSKNTYVRNQAYDFSSDTLATDLLAKMTTMYNDCSKLRTAGRSSPDIIITTQALYEEYEDQARSDYGRLILNDTNRANLGMGEMKFKGAEMYWDPDCPAGRIYFLNSDTIEFLYDPGYWMEMNAWKSKHNSLDRYAQIVTICNLVCNNFAKNGVMYGVA